MLLMQFYILATSKVISERQPTCTSALYSAAPGYRHHDPISHTVTLSDYPDTELTSLCSILVILSTKLCSHKYQRINH